MRPSFAVLFILAEIVIALLYIYYAQINIWSSSSQTPNPLNSYPMFQDVHVMIFIGFGFLMVFLRSHSWSSVGFNYLAAAVAIQVVPLFLAFWGKVINNNYAGLISIDVTTLYNAEFGAAAVLITMGAVLGKVNEAQLVFVAVFESLFYALNAQLGQKTFQASDVGGSVIIHAFGGFFGIALSIAVSNPRAVDAPNAKDGYWNDTVAMIGTVFLFVFWPSFNAVGGTQTQQYFIIPNTYFAIAGSVLATFALSSLYNKGKLRMDDVLNASLAGGVIIGANSNLVQNPGTALLIGLFGGIVSTFGFNRLTPQLAASGALHDTCGVTNLHAIPGLLGGLISAIVANGFDKTYTGGDLANIFPAEAATTNPRSAGQQAAYQFAYTLFTVILALVAGYICGLFIRSDVWAAPQEIERQFVDKEFWVITQSDYTQEGEGAPLVKAAPPANNSPLRQSRFQPPTTIVSQVRAPVTVLPVGQSLPVQFQYNVRVQKQSSNWLDDPQAAQRDLELAHSGETEM